MKTVRDACQVEANALSIKLSDQIEQLDELIATEGDGAAFFEKMGKEKAHFIVSQGPLVGKVQLVPRVEGRRLLEGFWNELIPGIAGRAARISNASRQHVQEEKAARNLPAA